MITIKAIHTMENCPIIAVPKTGAKRQAAYTIALAAYPALADKEVVDIDFPMEADRQRREENHRRAAEQVIRLLERTGKDVAFLTLGDPTIYSTFTYIQDVAKAEGYETELIPGVPSFCAVAARLNEALVIDGEALHVIPGSYDTIDTELKWKGTRVLMKTARSMEKVRKVLRENGLYDQSQMVQKCGMEGERVFKNLDEADDSAVYFSVIVAKDAAGQKEEA